MQDAMVNPQAKMSSLVRVAILPIRKGLPTPPLALMSLRDKHERIAKALSFTNLENFMESLSSIEYTLQSIAPEPQKSVVPLEANFQIPNVFLKTKKSFKVEKIFLEQEVGGEWNESLDNAIEFLDGIKLCITQSDDGGVLDEKLLEKMLMWRNGMRSR